MRSCDYIVINSKIFTRVNGGMFVRIHLCEGAFFIYIHKDYIYIYLFL